MIANVSLLQLLVLLVLNLVGFCIQSCLLSRHQALIKGRFKLGKVSHFFRILCWTLHLQPMNFVVRFSLFAFITSPAIYGFMIDWDASETDTLADFVSFSRYYFDIVAKYLNIHKNWENQIWFEYNVSWVRSRGPHMIYRRTTSLGVMLPAVILVVGFLSDCPDRHAVREIVLSYIHTTGSCLRYSLRNGSDSSHSLVHSQWGNYFSHLLIYSLWYEQIHYLIVRSFTFEFSFHSRTNDFK